MQPVQQDSAMPQLNLPDGVTVWDAAALDDERRNHNADGHADRLMQTINILGRRSKTSQKLNVVLTSVSRLSENNKSRLYLACSGGYGVGILKVGVKKLFVTHPSYFSLMEIDPLCVLDFFVDTSCQRQGFGKLLFDFMLAREKLNPGEVAIDRPSDKFLAFLQRHYGLTEYTPQSNNFVVFHRYFDAWQPSRGRSTRSTEAWNSGLPDSRQQHQGFARGVDDDRRNVNNAGNRNEPNMPSSLVPQDNQRPGHQRGTGDPSSQQPRNFTPYETQYEQYMRERAHQEQRRSSWLQSIQKPLSSAGGGMPGAGSDLGRHTSPSRSGVPYNIISGAPTR